LGSDDETRRCGCFVRGGGTGLARRPTGRSWGHGRGAERQRWCRRCRRTINFHVLVHIPLCPHCLARRRRRWRREGFGLLRFFCIDMVEVHGAELALLRQRFDAVEVVQPRRAHLGLTRSGTLRFFQLLFQRLDFLDHRCERLGHGQRRLVDASTCRWSFSLFRRRSCECFRGRCNAGHVFRNELLAVARELHCGLHGRAEQRVLELAHRAPAPADCSGGPRSGFLELLRAVGGAPCASSSCSAVCRCWAC